MKHGIIAAHPRADSFTLAVAKAYGEGLSAGGHEATLRDLYRMGFDPVLKTGEIPAPGSKPGADVEAERALLSECGAFALVYPIWLAGMPAMLKGYLERVFGFGFAFRYGADGPEGLLRGKALIVFSSSGAPQDWLVRTGSWAALRALTDEYLAELTGVRVVEHVHFGNVVPGMTKTVADRHLEAARAAAARHF